MSNHIHQQLFSAVNQSADIWGGPVLNCKFCCFAAWILVLVLCCWSGLSQNVTANCNEDIKLPCSVSYPGINYRYLVWYRDVTAIIKRKLNNVTFYNKSSPASLGVQDTLVLLNVQPSDSGYYQCFLAAEVGQKDRQSYVSLTVSGVSKFTLTILLHEIHKLCKN